MNHEQVVQEYIHRINTANVEGLLELMTTDHVFYVEGEPPLTGTEALREAWKGYCAAYPTYHIYVDAVYDQQEAVIVLGHTSGSHVPCNGYLGYPFENIHLLPIHLYLCYMERDGGRSTGVLLAASGNTLTHMRKTSLPYRTRLGSHAGAASHEGSTGDQDIVTATWHVCSQKRKRSEDKSVITATFVSC